MTTQPAFGPLAGIRVVDLTWMLAGPYCTMLLADLGADVIKVESPTGDPMREAGPFLADDEVRAFGGYFHSVNRNKRSLVLDLKSEQGPDTLRRLARGSDVVVENFRAGVMERLGVGYDVLKAAHPGLVYTSIRGFGDARTGRSPYVDRPAVDVTVQAMAGLMGITGPGPGQPLKAGPGIGDIFTAALAAVGTLAAVLNARATGRGQYVDLAMYDAVLSLCERIVYQYSYEGVVPEPQGNSHPIFCPFDIFPSADGFVSVDASSDHQWRDLAKGMGRPELGTDERFATMEARRVNAPLVRELVAGWTRGLTSAEVVAAVGERIPIGPVNDVTDIFADPHVAARRMLAEVEQPGAGRSVTLAGTAIKLDETPGDVRRRAPLLGEHSQEILEDAGFTCEEIDALVGSGTVTTGG
jgi:crotonobetainyl-CoA:carnitine CoA-transferase CaiB-like acyl-CoA transferase